jgi:hypothetical protein
MQAMHGVHVDVNADSASVTRHPDGGTWVKTVRSLSVLLVDGRRPATCKLNREVDLQLESFVPTPD